MRDYPIFRIKSTLDISETAIIKLVVPACFSHEEHSMEVSVISTTGKEALVAKLMYL